MFTRQIQRLPRLTLVRNKVPCFSSSANPNGTTFGSGTSSSSMAEQKQKLAQAAIKQVPLHGWTQDAITAAVLEHPNMTISMSGLFTPIELVNWLMDDFNRQLRQDSDKAAWSVYEKIKWRLEQVIPLVQSGHWHQGIALGLQTPETTRSQLHDFIELVAPPGSTMMYQTALGGIFVASELHLLADSSPDYEETWKFLQSRLNELENGQFVNIVGDGGSLPRAATTAVASSLLEGIASLILPTTLMGVPGTNPADYKPKQNLKK